MYVLCVFVCVCVYVCVVVVCAQEKMRLFNEVETGRRNVLAHIK